MVKICICYYLLHDEEQNDFLSVDLFFCKPRLNSKKRSGKTRLQKNLKPDAQHLHRLNPQVNMMKNYIVLSHHHSTPQIKIVQFQNIKVAVALKIAYDIRVMNVSLLYFC